MIKDLREEINCLRAQMKARELEFMSHYQAIHNRLKLADDVCRAVQRDGVVRPGDDVFLDWKEHLDDKIEPAVKTIDEWGPVYLSLTQIGRGVLAEYVQMRREFTTETLFAVQRDLRIPSLKVAIRVIARDLAYDDPESTEPDDETEDETD